MVPSYETTQIEEYFHISYDCYAPVRVRFKASYVSLDNSKKRSYDMYQSPFRGVDQLGVREFAIPGVLSSGGPLT